MSDDKKKPSRVDDDQTQILHDTGLPSGQPQQPYLLVVAGSKSLGKLFPIRHGMTIGRAKDADIVLTEEGVSRIHARVQIVAGDVVRISDLHSSQGVKVDGARMAIHVLRTGQRVRLGDAVLTLVRMEDDVTTLCRNLAESSMRIAAGRDR